MTPDWFATGVSESSPRTRTETHAVVVLVVDGFQTLDLAGPVDVFGGANDVLDAADDPRPRYDVRIVTPGGSATSEYGMTVLGAEPHTIEGPIDTLLIPGGRGVQRASHDPATVAVVAELGARARRKASVCTGAFAFAAAGFADDRRVATHWARAEALRRAHPEVTVLDDAIGCVDGDLWSSAGVTAGIDLALSMVEFDLSVEVAQTVARWLVVFARRPGGQSQYAAPVWSDRATTSGIRVAQEAVEADPADDHRVATLAARAAMSERHFARRFRDEVGISPGQFVQRVRAERARDLLEGTDLDLATVARDTGLGTAESLRRVFHRHFGTAPAAYRARFAPADNPILTAGTAPPAPTT